MPEYVLQGIFQTALAPQHVINRCQSTIEKTKQLQDVRITYEQSIGAAQAQRTSPGIVVPYILESISRNAATEQQRESARHALAYSTKHRTDSTPTRHLNRTVYDAQNSRAHYPPNRVLIREGGPLLALEHDPTNNANECYNGFGKAYNFYFNFLQRDYFDNKGMKLDGFIHVGDFYNALFNGRRLVFGDGDRVIFDGFTDKSDIIGHELSHGVVHYTSPLPYKSLSGAPNETIAVVFGITVKQWGESTVQIVDQVY